MKLVLGLVLTAIAVFAGSSHSFLSDLDCIVIFGVGAYLIVTSTKKIKKASGTS